MPIANSSLPQRSLLDGGNALKIGLFGANCSSGRAVTKVPERWSGTWADNLALAKMADEAGIDFLLPIGRWKGYGGDTGYQEATLETVTWATGLLAATKRITVFGTVHAPLFHPIIAAKQMVTADHIGEGRFGLNIVVGWNEGEFEMFGVEQREHATRYEYAQEWIDAIKLMWSERDDFDFDGAVHQAEEGARQAEALWRHAARHHERRRIAGRPRLRGAQLRCVLHAGRRAPRSRRPRSASPRVKAEAAAQGRAHQRVHGRRHHLPADHEGGRGLSPSCRGRSGRLVGGRSVAGAPQHHAADHADGGVHAAARPDTRTATAACRSSAIRITSRGS